jgi:hypothetical protein
MYTIDRLDTVTELTEVPQSSTGSPCPLILCGDDFVHLAYRLNESIENWDGVPRSISRDSPGELCALVRFKFPSAQMFGEPNDECIPGHPLMARGLQYYSVSEVHNSSWIRALARLNEGHPHRNATAYAGCRHFIFSFHDNVFECVAEGYDLSVHRGSVASVLQASWPER